MTMNDWQTKSTATLKVLNYHTPNKPQNYSILSHLGLIQYTSVWSKHLKNNIFCWHQDYTFFLAVFLKMDQINMGLSYNLYAFFRL